ncbi:hypothetical protein E2C01_031763 [Portunus trituberculatus]|uniref:Uncharacterized protein n=1 Tax=Portunus trituberculatus TaxID=210409 RepID=A0A5B7EYI9_PORTR|nr:hypothetical protein [Portunus trituberculatus]
MRRCGECDVCGRNGVLAARDSQVMTEMLILSVTGITCGIEVEEDRGVLSSATTLCFALTASFEHKGLSEAALREAR